MIQLIQPVWQEKAPGVWSAVVGQPKGVTPLSAADCKPLTEALRRMGGAELPFARDEVQVEALAGGGYLLRLPLAEQEKLFGLGLQFMRMNHRGRTRYLRVNSDPKQDTGESHAPVPFYVTDRGCGVLVNTARVVTVHAGATVRADEQRADAARDRNTDRGWQATPVSAYVEIRLPAEGAEVLLFAGANALDTVRRYNLYCGGGTLPPRWGLGFWHRVPKLFSDREAVQEALEFRRRDFPCDVIGLEPGWHSRSYPVTYEWAHDRFPDPRSFVAELGLHGFRVNLWEHPYVSPEAPLYERLRPLSGNYTVWGGLAPDYTLEEAQVLYCSQHEEQHVRIGVSGYKLDECDGSELTNNSWMFPAHAQFPSGHDGEQMRQLYGLLFQKMTEDLYRRQNVRTYGLVRASNAGASSLPYVLYSDLYDHRQFVRALCNASFSGLLWTPEVRKAQNAEDWVRRMQSVVFSPMAMLNAWGDGTKPWSFPEVEHIVRHYIKLRMRLMPYLYTAFARYRFDGTPPFRAMPLVLAEAAEASGGADGGGGMGVPASRTDASAAGPSAAVVENTTDGAYGKTKAKEWDDQFMVGGDLLVAPLFAGEASREVLLPPGVWYGLETGERYDGGVIVTVQSGLERIPVFVREGAVIPLMPALDRAPRAGEKVPLDIVHFGDASGEALLYDDDGETFDYERGQHIWRKLVVRRNGDGSLTGEISDVSADESGGSEVRQHEAANEAGSAGDFYTYDSVQWHLGKRSLADLI
ncbi:TIM-barrel domain-containing protein [Paenibacillus hamazuiensis]|uniref:glycoside hydrolase family 31 protein n=1 Tax=Paenibacillus hamazuiensis TaxID=2936508 RepID=UPI00200FAD7D|nr:TIM-barrel domain-containing protein [Paenibacillus hamazuiensis]